MGAPVLWENVREHVRALANERGILDVFRSAGIPATTGFDLFNPAQKRVQFDNVSKLLNVLGLTLADLPRLARRRPRERVGG